MGRFCFPKIIDEPVEITEEDKKYINGEPYIQYDKFVEQQEQSQKLINLSVIKSDKLISWLGDLFLTWPALLGSFGWSIIIAFLFMWFLKCCAGCIVYTVILLILGCLVVLSLFFFKKVDQYDAVDDTAYRTTMQAFAWIFVALAVIWLIVILCMCNRIRLAANLMEVTGEYIG